MPGRRRGTFQIPELLGSRSCQRWPVVGGPGSQAVFGKTGFRLSHRIVLAHAWPTVSSSWSAPAETELPAICRSLEARGRRCGTSQNFRNHREPGFAGAGQPVFIWRAAHVFIWRAAHVFGKSGFRFSQRRRRAPGDSGDPFREVPRRRRRLKSTGAMSRIKNAARAADRHSEAAVVEQRRDMGLGGPRHVCARGRVRNVSASSDSTVPTLADSRLFANRLLQLSSFEAGNNRSVAGPRAPLSILVPSRTLALQRGWAAHPRAAGRPDLTNTGGVTLEMPPSKVVQ
eukprot:gene22488-biopygen16253